MGAYAPAPVFTPDLQELVKRTIMLPTINGMRRDGKMGGKGGQVETADH